MYQPAHNEPAMYPIEDDVDRRLFSALYTLMQKSLLEDISVGQILDEARVSRSSFYRHYLDKYDLLIRSYTRLLDSTYLQCLAGREYLDASRALVRVLYQHSAFFRNALWSEGPNSLSVYICNISIDMIAELLIRHGLNMKVDIRLRYAVESYVYGTYRVMQEWARDGMPYPPDELTSLFVELIPEKLKPYLLS